MSTMITTRINLETDLHIFKVGKTSQHHLYQLFSTSVPGFTNFSNLTRKMWLQYIVSMVRGGLAP